MGTIAQWWRPDAQIQTLDTQPIELRCLCVRRLNEITGKVACDGASCVQWMLMYGPITSGYQCCSPLSFVLSANQTDSAVKLATPLNSF
eukprot:1137053-Pelagomonas_calceolata.AAC.6